MRSCKPAQGGPTESTSGRPQNGSRTRATAGTAASIARTRADAGVDSWRPDQLEVIPQSVTLAEAGAYHASPLNVATNVVPDLALIVVVRSPSVFTVPEAIVVPLAAMVTVRLVYVVPRCAVTVTRPPAECLAEIVSDVEFNLICTPWDADEGRWVASPPKVTV